VQNWTLARDACQQPLLRELHGSFIEPVSINTTHDLVPIFGGSKLTGLNQDILIPPAAYLSNSFSGGVYAGTNDPGPPWEEKKAGAVWRGVASGGRNREENWKRFHRHRFVAMLNGTAVEHAETNPDAPHQGENFHLQSYSVYGLTATKLMDLGSWLKRVTNVGFTNLECFPTIDDRTCSYTSPYFTLVSTISMAKQYAYKLLPDPDGNSFSGRYLASCDLLLRRSRPPSTASGMTTDSLRGCTSFPWTIRMWICTAFWTTSSVPDRTTARTTMKRGASLIRVSPGQTKYSA
jgi:hypothetical protein